MTFSATFTYDKYDSEGNDLSHGFITPGMWDYPLNDENCDATLKEAREGWFDITDLAEAVRFAQQLGINARDDFRSNCPDENLEYFGKGIHTYYAMHIQGVTDATKARIARLVDFF